MAEVYDRLGRLDRREQLARRAAQPAMPQLEEAPAPGGEDDGFAEVLEAVGRVVRRWPGIAVMVAQDGRPGQPVIRMSERDGDVDAAVVGHRVGPPPALAPTAAPATPPRATPAPPRAVPAPPRIERPYVTAAPTMTAPTAPAPPARAAAAPSATPSAASAPAAFAAPSAPAPSASAPAAAAFAAPAGARVGTGRMAEALGGATRASRVERAAEPEARAEGRRPELRLVPDLPAGRHASPEDADEAPAGPSGRVPLPSETSEAVARLAQILRANPSLAATWGRESQEG